MTQSEASISSLTRLWTNCIFGLATVSLDAESGLEMEDGRLLILREKERDLGDFS